MTLETSIAIPLWLMAGLMLYNSRRMHLMSTNLARLQASAVAIVALAAEAVAKLESIPTLIREAIEADEASEDGELGSLADQLDSAAADLKAQLPEAATDAGHVDDSQGDTGNSSGDSTPPASTEPNSSDGSVSGSDSVAVVDDPEQAPDDQDSTVG